MSDLVWLTATDLVERYRAKKLSPVEVAAAYLERIGRLDRQLNSYITVTADRARARAKEAETRFAQGAPLSPVDGVPFAPKDIFATSGIATGSKLGMDNVPTYTATAVAKLEAAGAVMLGKLNLLEYATGSGTESASGRRAIPGTSNATLEALRAEAVPRWQQASPPCLSAPTPAVRSATPLPAAASWA